MTEIAEAIVLAAGYGTRMRPLTDSCPKPMVPLRGVALIDRVLNGLARAGIAHCVVNVHYLADKMTAHLAHRTAPRISISDECGRLLDTGGGIKHALDKLGDKAFLTHNSDSVWWEEGTSNLERLIAVWEREKMDCLMLLADANRSIGYSGAGDFTMEADGRLVRKCEDDRRRLAFCGVSIVHPRIFESAPDGPFSMNLLWDRSIARRRLYGHCLDGVWMHVGTPQALAQAEAFLADRNAG